MNSFTVEKKDEGMRLSKYISRIIPAAPQSLVYRLIRTKDIRLNGKKAEGSEILKHGDTVLFRFPDAQFNELSKKNCCPHGGRTDIEKDIRLSDYCTIIFEDEDIIAADKKEGVLSQKARPSDVSVNEALLMHCKGAAGTFTPSVCNRLDRNTTGLILFAKTYRGAKELGELLKSRKVSKYYLAAVWGNVLKGRRLTAVLSKNRKTNTVTVAAEGEGSLIETAYEPIETAEFEGHEITLIKVRLITGKAHQIRAHLAYEGYPVIGDAKYTNRSGADRMIREKLHINHQMLHSYEIDIPGRGVIRAPVPLSFKKLFSCI